MSSIELPIVKVGSAHCRIAAEAIRLAKMGAIGVLEKFHIVDRALSPGAGVAIDAVCDDADVWVWGEDEALAGRWLMSRTSRVGVMLFFPRPAAVLLAVSPGGVFCYSAERRDFFASYAPRRALMAGAIASCLWGDCWEKE